MTTGRINQVITKPTQPPKQLNSERLAGRLNRIHQMDTFNSHSLECKYPMPSLHLWLRHKSNANPSKKELCIKTQSRQGRVLGVPCKTQNCDQAPETFIISKQPYSKSISQPSFPIPRWTLMGRKGWADANNPRIALRLNWAEWESKAQAFTQQSEGRTENIGPNPL